MDSPTERPTASQITDDQLDALYRKLDRVTRDRDAATKDYEVLEAWVAKMIDG